MKNVKINVRKNIFLVTIVSIIFTTSGLRAEERIPASAAFSAGTKEFLSDPARTGSVLGSILAGAAVANPLAPLLGSVAGFMIGKSSAFTKKDGNIARNDAYNNRSLVPDDGLGVSGLTGLTGSSPLPPEQPVFLGLRRETLSINPSEQSKQVIIMGLPEEPATGDMTELTEQTVSIDFSETSGQGSNLQMQKELAYACSNSTLTQPLSPSCYYFSQ